MSNFKADTEIMNAVSKKLMQKEIAKGALHGAAGTLGVAYGGYKGYKAIKKYKDKKKNQKIKKLSENLLINKKIKIMSQLFENYQEYIDYANLNETRVPKTFLKKAAIRGKALFRKGSNKFKGSAVGGHIIRNKTKYAAGTALAGGAVIGNKIGKKNTYAAAGKARMNEAMQYGISPNQFLHDVEVLKNIRSLCEAENVSFVTARDNYFVEQRDAALEFGHNDAAVYYDNYISE